MSDSSFYKIEKTSNKSTANFSVAPSDNILVRRNNFGLKFTGDDTFTSTTKPPTSASITVPPTASYRAVEFWFRPDSIKASTVNGVLNAVSASTDSPAIWIDSSSKFQFRGQALYINGASAATGTVTASANELYHMVITTSALYNSNLYLNGDVLATNAVKSKATYGYLYFWKNNPSDSDVLGRFQSFFYINAVGITDNNTSRIVTNSSTESYKFVKIGLPNNNT
jgi:hypothetical protein